MVYKNALIALVASVPLVFFVYPIFLVLRISFFVDGKFSLLNYTDFFSSNLFLRSFLNSFLIPCISVMFIAPIGLITVYFLRNSKKMKKVARLISSFPLLFSSYIFSISLLFIYGRIGIISVLLNHDFSFLVRSFNGVIFANSIFYLPYFILPLFSSFEEVNPNLEEVAESLGSTGFHKFRKVIFPQISRGFFVGILITFLLIFNQISVILAMGGGKTYTLVYMLFAQYGLGRFGTTTAIAVISLVSTFLITLFFHKILLREKK